MPIQVQIAKWGNSLGLRVPRDIAARVGLTEGGRVDIEASEDGRIIVTPSRMTRRARGTPSRPLADRGSLVLLHFSLQAGSEQAGRRPGIVLTKEAYHRRSRLAVVCPITGREKGWPMEARLPPGLAVSGVILVDHVRSVHHEARGMEVIGPVRPP